jgi:hypothetical protein
MRPTEDITGQEHMDGRACTADNSMACRKAVIFLAYDDRGRAHTYATPQRYFLYKLNHGRDS